MIFRNDIDPFNVCKHRKPRLGARTAWGLAGDYFQVLRNIIAPAALMVRQQSSLIITPEWEYSF